MTPVGHLLPHPLLRVVRRTLPGAFAFACLASAGLTQIQALQLRSGEVVLGRVTDVGEQSLQVQITYPTVEQRTIARDDVTPQALWNVLAARTPSDDARAHLELGRAARELGLPGQAIAALREAQRLDPELQDVVEQQIAETRDGVAQRLLEQAREAADAQRPLALLMLRAITDRYGDTPAAEEALRLRRRLTRELERGDRATTTAPPAPVAEPRPPEPRDEPGRGGTTQAQRQLDSRALQKLLQDAAERLERVAGIPAPAAPSTVQHQRSLEQRVQLLEPVWRTVRVVAPPADEPQLADHLAQVQQDTKRLLMDAYVGLGSLLAQRQAFPEALDYAERACGVDPNSDECHRVYQLIQLGRTLGGRW